MLYGRIATFPPMIPSGGSFVVLTIAIDRSPDSRHSDLATRAQLRTHRLHPVLARLARKPGFRPTRSENERVILSDSATELHGGASAWGTRRITLLTCQVCVLFTSCSPIRILRVPSAETILSGTRVPSGGLKVSVAIPRRRPASTATPCIDKVATRGASTAQL